MLRAILMLMPGLAAAVCVAYLLLRRRSEKWPGILYILFINLLVALLGWAVLCLANGNLVVDLISNVAALNVPPAYLLYMRGRFKYNFRLKPYLMFLPSLIIFVSNTVLYLIMGWDQANEYFNHVSTLGFVGDDAPTLWYVKRFFGSVLFRVFFAVQSVLSIGWVFLCINKDLVNLGKMDEPLRIQLTTKMKGINFATFVLIATILLFNSMTFADYVNDLQFEIPISIMLTATVLVLGYFILIQFNPAWISQSLIDIVTVKNSSNEESATFMDVLQFKFERYMMQKPYCSPDVSLTSVSEALNTNRTYLSEMINQRYGKSFSEYVAEQRVRNAMSLLQSSDIMIKDAAELSGYKTMSTFYRNFLTINGVSVTDWVKEHGYKG